MVKLPTIDELSQAGVQLGHKITKSSPQMRPYIEGAKNNIHQINLAETVKKLGEALDFIVQSVSQGATILFLGTKPAAKEVIKKYAQKINVPYVAEHWIAGTLTNFATIFKLIEKLKKMAAEKQAGEWSKYTKKEELLLDRELNRLEEMVGGIKTLIRRPDVIYVVDIGEEKTAIQESRRSRIPVVAIVDTSSDPRLVDYPIPANDDGINSIELITSLVAKAVEEGREKIPPKADQPRAEKDKGKITAAPEPKEEPKIEEKEIEIPGELVEEIKKEIGEEE